MELSTVKETGLSIGGTTEGGEAFGGVIHRYQLAIAKQSDRRERQGRDFYTKAEQTALAFYTAAIEKIRAL